MRRLALSLAVLAAVAAAAPARAAVRAGLGCHLLAVDDPTTPENAYGVVYGGPLVTTDGAALRCLVQVNLSTHAHWGSVSSSVGAGLVSAAGPNTVAFHVTPSDTAYVCTELVRPDGTTLFWDTARRRWTADASASCGRVTHAGRSYVY